LWRQRFVPDKSLSETVSLGYYRAAAAIRFVPEQANHVPEKNSNRLPSIRSQIALLVLACALPTVIGFGAVVRQFYSRERDTLREDTQQSARMVAAAIDRDLVQSESAALALAASPSLGWGDLDALHLQAGSLLGPQFPASQFLLSDAAGKVRMHVGAPAPETLTAGDNAKRLAPLFADARPRLSVVYQNGGALLAVDVPVFVDSHVRYTLSAILKPDRLPNILREESLTPQQAMTLYDGDGIVVAQSGARRMLLGQPAAPSLRKQLSESREALLSAENADGEAIYLGFSRSPVSGATVAIATPQAMALKELFKAVTMISLTMGLVLLAAFTLAWTVGGRIARSIRDLVGPAQALASGTPFTLETMTFREADEVGQAFRALEADLSSYHLNLETLVADRTSQLERSRAQLETLYATAPVGLSYVDSELRFVRLNEYLAALNQRTVVEHLGRHVSEMIPDDELRRAVLKDYRTVLESGRPLAGLQRCGRPASSPNTLCHWVVSYYPQFGADGKIVAITGLLLDVTEHKRVEAELQASRQLISSVVENIPAMIFLKRASDLRYDMFNRYGALLHGHDSGDVFLGKNDYDFVPAEQADFFIAADRRVLDSARGEVIEIAEEPVTNAAGTTRFLTSRKVALRDESGAATHVLGIAFDITERKHDREMLRATADRLARSEHFVRAVTDNLPGMVAYWDAGLRCRFANRYFLDWHGKTDEQMMGALMPELVGDEEFARLGQYVQAALNGQPQGFASHLRWPSGDLSYTWVNYIPDVNDTGTVQGFFVLVSDVTELKETELHLQQLNEELIVARDRAEAASRAKSEFLANMSHEIRTPMNAITGLARLLEEAPLAPRERGYLDKIQVATHSLLGLVNDVLDFSRVEAGQLELEHAEFSMRRLLDSISVMVSGSAHDKGIELIYEIDPALPAEVAGDARRLQQVLLNLMGNAIKFTERGEVVLSVRPATAVATPVETPVETPANPLVKPGDRAALIEFRVRDTGIGIAADKQAGIFDAFSQADSSTSRRFGGAGLGLAICRKLADMMGGAISVASEPGRGSEFLFTCPLECVAPAAAPQVPEAAAGLSVLIVDDNASARQALATYCRAFGWRAACADGAVQAQQMLERDAAGYDLMLLDRDMPGTDGAAMLQQIHAAMSVVLPPVLMMTSEHVAAKLAQQAGELGLAGIVSKPVNPLQLLERAAAVLSGEAGAGEQLTQQASPLHGRLAGMRILLVEDNEINQEVAQYILLHAGATVATLENGELAVELLRNAPDRFDVVLMDVQMPVMNGYDATKAIRDNGLHGLPVVAMTANVMEDDRRRAAEAGMNAHVAKPIDVEELISVLTRLAPPAVPQLAAAESAAGTATGAGAEAGAGSASASGAGPEAGAAAAFVAAAEAGTGAAVRAAPSAAGALPASLPGIDLNAALARLGGNRDALVSLLKRFEQSQGGTVAEVRALLDAGQRQQAAQSLHRLRGVAANLGATTVARLTADAETALHLAVDAAGLTMLQAALNALDSALNTVSAGARTLSAGADDMPASNTPHIDLPQKLAELQGLLQNNNMKALEHFQQLKPALAKAEHAGALAEAVETLNFKAAHQMVEDMLQRKESA
jgi:PAS domain S-box-containing protein